MSQLRPEEVDKLFKKPAEKRYEYFIKKVCDTEEVYGLADEEGWALLSDDDDDTDIIPLFPHIEAAERFRVEGDFEEYGIGVLDVHELLEWLDDMKDEKMMVAIFPNLELSGVVYEPERLQKDLIKELATYDADGRKKKS
jgi:hypothetical protein